MWGVTYLEDLGRDSNSLAKELLYMCPIKLHGGILNDFIWNCPETSGVGRPTEHCIITLLRRADLLAHFLFGLYSEGVNFPYTTIYYGKAT